MFLAAMRVLDIKDLKDLSFLSVGDTIDMQDLKDLKRCFYGCARGGQAPALRYARPPLFTVGRGPVPRHASVGEMALAGGRFSRRSGARGGQAPALRARKGFSSPCPVRERVLPNYGHWGPRALAGDTRSDARMASEGPRATN